MTTSLTVTTAALDSLQPYHRNPRRGNTAVIGESLDRLGQYRPIVVNAGTYTGREREVLAGNHTFFAAQKLGWDTIDIVTVDVDEDTATRIVVADNRTSDLATYDEELLAALLQELPDLDGTGFTDAALEEMLAELAAGDGHVPILGDPDDAPDLPDEADAITEPGQVWELGEHRLLCGDSTDQAAVEAFMGGDRADCMWTDPPYGVDYVGKTKDALTIRNDGAKGLEALLAGVFATAVAVLKPGAPAYVAHSDSRRGTFETEFTAAGFSFRQNLLWVKDTMVLGHSDYHYRHEPILYGFAPGGEGRLGRGGERWYGDNAQTTVFEVPKPARSEVHPNMKPVDLIVLMLENSSRPGAMVFEPFGGSGSTLIAAHMTRRVARVVELDPRYVDVILRRWQEATGVRPRLDGAEHDFAGGD